MKRARVAMVLLGVGGLLARGRFEGAGGEWVHSYGGNVAVSWAVFFVCAAAEWGGRWGRWVAAGVALAAVELFEATDGFGVMANTYDGWDFVANAVGVGLAAGADGVVAGIAARWAGRFSGTGGAR